MTRREEILVRDAGQSALLGVAAGAGAFGVALLLAVVIGWRWWVAPLSGVVVGAVVFALAAVVLVRDSRSWLWRLEEVVSRDVTGDGVVGDPGGGHLGGRGSGRGDPLGDPRFVYVRNVKAEQERRRAGDFRGFLRGCYNGKGTTWRSWRGEVLPSGERVTRPRWEEFCERLERAGLGSRPYETAALELSSSYRDALEAFAEIL